MYGDPARLSGRQGFLIATGIPNVAIERSFKRKGSE